MRILRDFQSVFSFMVDTFRSCKDLQSADHGCAVGQGEKHEYNHGDILLYFFFTVFITRHSNGILVFFIGWLFNAL